MMQEDAGHSFAWLDWLVLAGYLATVVAIGVLATRRRRDADDFFLAGRAMPMWVVAISVLATAQSAATFVGGPEQAYAGDLTYLASNIGPILAAIVVALFFIPAFYRHGVTSVYELIGREMGSAPQRLASAMFMIGRVFASGARLFIVAIPFSLVAFGDIEPAHLLYSILIVSAVATAYSLGGGIRAVIWTDALQVLVYLSCLVFALWLIWQQIPAGMGEIIEALRTSEDAEGEPRNKLRIFDFSLDPAAPFTVWSSAIGLTLLMIAAYGADQDLTQRMLTCKNARSASWSMITATLIGLPVVFLFLLMGLLLYVFYDRPDLMGAAAPGALVDDSREVFLNYILTEMPAGVRGLMMAGLFAAAMSSMDSSLNAMGSTTVADFVRPWRAKRAKALADDSPLPPRQGPGEGQTIADDSPLPSREGLGEGESQSGDITERRIGRAASLFWSIAITGFACICIIWQEASEETLIPFALGVMTFAYAGLLGVFFTAIFTSRGSARSTVAALVAGFLIVLALQPWALPHLIEQLTCEPFTLAFTWRLTIAAGISFLICLAGKRESVG